jgi:MFS family permease
VKGPEGDGPTGLRLTTIAALLFAAAQAPLGSTMIAVGLPSISHDLHRDLALTTSLLVTSYLIVNIIGQSPGGKLGDVLGYPRAVRLGMALQAAGGLAGIFAQGLGLLVLSRCAMALGGALVMPATIALLRVHVPAERRGRMFGVVGSTMGLSASLGPALGGELVTRFGWRSMFLAPLVFLGIAVTLARIAPLPENSNPRTSASEFARGFDWTGTTLFALGLAALVLSSKMMGGDRTLSLAASAGTLLAFVLWELRTKNPVLDPRLFSRGVFTASSSVVALQNFAMYGLIFQLPQFFQQIRGATPKEVGRVLFTMMIAMFASSLLGGRVTDRFGARRTALLGALTTLMGMVWLQRLDTFFVPREAAPALLLLGLGLGLCGAPTQASAMASVRAEQAGMAAGATSTMRYLGGVASILVLGSILGEHGGATLDAHITAVRVATIAAGLAAVACLGLPGAVATPPSPR